ncbi:MAG: GYD domain-containing protein [Thaumarchaeota archaeon 13_1_40CM_3_50_5]|nr:MAG: GYD domain-containing protein [Thaumarchaeota archaeon 13_1_40CM_3_50_5]TLX99623.1 MAG: GYD domain-containing protein [Nitrososphaerota archaeon]TLY10124.1 MAG: GYD domain-containing protein [Nitrososphaerota archaeon]TLY11130.1 MAG: GYD domain-containing protein [Nitrososphaerota archaeon]
MPTYMIQGAYGTEGLAAIVKNPQNRIQAVKPAIESLGGKLKDAYFSFGDYDFVIIADMPDNVSAVAISLAFGAGGALKTTKTTPLLSAAETMEAMKKASRADYKPPTM